MRTSLVLVAALALTFAAVAVHADEPEARTFSSGRCSNKKPSAPKNLNASPLNPTTVRLTWRAKDDACVDEFEITYKAEGVPQPRTFSPVKVKAYTVDIPGLEANTRYVFTVRALNNRNGASASAETRTTTPSRCNGPPRPPMDVKTRSDSPTSITVNWLTEANDPCIERFEVTYVLESSTIAPRSLAPLYVTEKTVTLTGLQPDSTYSIVIASVGKNGQRASVTTKGKTKPNCSPLKAPANTYGKQVGPRALQLTWDNPQPACVKTTQVSYVDSSGARGPVTNLGSSDEQFTFANIQPGKEYTLSVRYIGKDGQTGPASSAKVFAPNNSQGGTISVSGRR